MHSRSDQLLSVTEPRPPAATAVKAARPVAAEFVSAEVSTAPTELAAAEVAATILANVLPSIVVAQFALIADLASCAVDRKMVWCPFASLTCPL